MAYIINDEEGNEIDSVALLNAYLAATFLNDANEGNGTLRITPLSPPSSEEEMSINGDSESANKKGIEVDVTEFVNFFKAVEASRSAPNGPETRSLSGTATSSSSANTHGASTSGTKPDDNKNKGKRASRRPDYNIKEVIARAEAENRPIRLYDLLMATLKGDWDGPDGVKNILESSSLEKKSVYNYFEHQITDLGETVLHMAVQSGKHISFLKNVLELYVLRGIDLTTLGNAIGRTPLHQAAEIGNLAAAKLLVETDPRLLLVENDDRDLPVHDAALAGRRELVEYLLEQTKQTDISLFNAEAGVRLLNTIVHAGFNDIGYEILKEFPLLARMMDHEPCPTILVLATHRKAFPSGSDFSFWEQIIYSWLPIDVEIQNHEARSQLAYVGRKLFSLMWKIAEIIVPSVKYIREKKKMHHHTLQLTKLICSDLYLPSTFIKFAISLSARAGIHEILEELLRTFPATLHTLTFEDYTIFEAAVKYRHVNVYNLMFQMSDYKYRMLQHGHFPMGTLLHFAARLPPQERLNVVSGAALQMQRELQWFKEVEKVVRPSYKEKTDGPRLSSLDPNWKPRTPSILFAEEHRELVIEGEKWMKDTANSCMIAAVLIATVVFAASITVPGGNNSDTGSPIFSKNKAFLAFAVSDAIALYSSVASMIMFLSILTSRYTQEDFLHSLPKRLIIGLVTLFLSMTFMMAAFSAAMYLVFGNQKAWILLLVGAFSCLPVSLFVSLQFPLLLEMIRSTYGRSIFGKQSDHVIF